MLGLDALCDSGCASAACIAFHAGREEVMQASSSESDLVSIIVSWDREGRFR